jgi:cytochrome c biogenesis protein CcmG/thiol:disulfide interchange protein DsbE
VNRRVLVLGLLVALPLLGLLLVNLGRDPYRIASPLVGKPAPDFRLRAVGSAETLSLASLRGRPVVVNFWSTWCPPCFEEHRVLTAAARNLGSRVHFVGVVYDDEEATIRRFLSEYGDAYPMLMDENGRVAIAYGIHGVPESFFLDADGVIVSKVEGPLDPGLLSARVTQAAGKES